MKKTLKDYSFYNKTVLLRCDLNVPMNGDKILDDTRIVASLETINYLINDKAKVVIFSHLGKIKSEEDKKDNTLYPVYLRLCQLLKCRCYFSKELQGIELEKKINDMDYGEVLLVENTRFLDVPDKLESGCSIELSKYWASLGDIFVNDAYGTCHRAHASNAGIAKYLPSAIGFLVQNEVTKLSGFMGEKSHPFVLIMGGKKVSDKTLVIDNLVQKCDKILIGGGMCFTFLKAMGLNIGESIVDDDNIDYCKKILEKYRTKIFLPVDIINQNGVIKRFDRMLDTDIGYDIGPETVMLFTNQLKNAKRVIINGPMGMYEDKRFSNGTACIYNYLKNNKIKTLIGGGDSAASVNELGFSNVFYHVSTGGGATLEYLGGNKLPGIDVINEK